MDEMDTTDSRGYLADVGRSVADIALSQRFAGCTAEAGIAVLLLLILQEQKVRLVHQVLDVHDATQ